MKYKAILFCFLVLMLSSFSMGQQVDDGILLGGMPLNPQPADLTGRYFVMFHSPPGAAERDMVLSTGATIRYQYKIVPAYAIYTTNAAAVDAIRSDQRVSYVDPVKVRYALGDAHPWGIDTVKAPQVWSTTTGQSVKIAVLDTGIDSLHYELDARYKGGYDFANDDPNPWDGHGHGTHVSGTIAAELNDIGVVGVAYNVDLYALKVLHDVGFGFTDDLLAAIDWCVDNGIRIANMSLGGDTPDPTEDMAFQNAYNRGLLSIAAAGNGPANSGVGVNFLSFPAGYASVLSVGAVDINLQRAGFSNGGPDLEVVAPGVDVKSTVPRGTGHQSRVDFGSTIFEANALEFAGLTSRDGITRVAINCGQGNTPDEFPASVSGNIALMQRGGLTFAAKVRNAQNAGAVAAIIYNNAPGNFNGTLGIPLSDWIPAVSLSQADGQTLVAAGSPTVTVVNSEDDFDRFSGTSMACPHAVGVAALVLGARPVLQNFQVRDILKQTATDLGEPGRDEDFGFGIVNAQTAVARAQDEPEASRPGSVSSLGDTVTWTGFIAAGANLSGADACTFEGPANDCDRFFLTVNSPLSGPREAVRVTIDNFGANDLDLVVRNEQGQTVTSSGSFAGIPEVASFPANPGTYEIIVIGFAAAAASYTGTATVIEGPGVRQPTYVQGGIQFSPNVTPQAPELPRGGEPSIRVDRDGFMYAGGIRGLTSGGVDLWRWDTKIDPCLQDPTHLGQPIEIPETQVGDLGGGDMEIATSQPDNPNDTPVLTVASLLLANVPIAITFDRGNTWERHELGEKILTGAGATDRHWLTAYGNNTVYLSGRELISVTLSDLWVSTSIDHGRTWSPRTFVRIAANSTPGYIDVDRRPIGSGPGAGNIYFSHQNSSTMFVSVADPSPIPGVSPTGGPLSFQTFVVDNTTSHDHLFDVVRVGRDGTVYAVWSSGRDVYLATSTDQARSWSAPVQVNNPNTVDVNGRAVRTNIFPWLVPGDRGRVGIVWFGSNGINSADNNGDWNVYYVFTANALDFNPTFQQVQASDHFIHATNVSEFGLGGAANRNLLDFFQVDMDPTGAAVIAFGDDHNDFDGQTYVTRQVSGPSLLTSTGTVTAVSCPAVPSDHNPQRLASDPEVIDFRNDAQVLRRVTIQTDVPFDITSIDYSDQFSEMGTRQLAVTISVSDMTNPPLEGFHWMAFFAANARNDLFDRGQSFFIEASTDPRDGASALAPLFFYGTSVRRNDGGFNNTRVGSADGGSFDADNNTITIVLGLDKINAIAEPDIDVDSRLIGLRGISFAGGGVDINVPVIGRITGSDVERDFTRGGLPFVIGSSDPLITLECDDPSITRLGGWHNVEDERATNGHYCRAVEAKKNKADPFLSFTFTGTAVEVQLARGPRGANAEIFIDDVSQGILSFFRPASDPTRPDKSGKRDLTFGISERYKTTAGIHTFRLVVLNDVETENPPQDMVYVDGFIIRGIPQGTGNPTESSTATTVSIDPAGIGSLPLTADLNTTLLTGVLEVPEDADLDLLIVDPLGSVVGEANTEDPTEVVQVTPTLTGIYLFNVVNKSPLTASYTLYQITTEEVTVAPKAQASSPAVKEIPKSFGLDQNYPNPFNPITEIKYGLPENANVRLKVFNVLGQEVATLVDGMQDAGYKSVSFDASRLSSGVYFYKLTAGSFFDVKRMMIMK